MSTESYVIMYRVWNQVGPLAEVTETFSGVQVYCSLGEIYIIINGISFHLEIGEHFDEGIIDGRTFEITGTGTWKGFLRGTR